MVAAMYEKAFHLEIITPQRIVFQGEASSVSAPGVLGGFQVLYNHAPLISALQAGTIKVKDVDGNDLVYATSGGFVEAKDNQVTVLADTAERRDEIDVDRARAAKERALKRLREREEAVDIARAQAALARALNRLRVAQQQ